MGELRLIYGTMAAGKSTMALQLAWQLAKGHHAVSLWTFGDRSGDSFVTSRIGVTAPATAVRPGADLSKACAELVGDGVSVLIIDEVQFATTEQIDQLALLVDEHDMDVHCFGLGADFLLEPFAGTSRLFAIADFVTELPLAAYCWCGRRGRCNARVSDGVVQRAGGQHLVGDTSGDISYQVLCRRHYHAGQLG